MGTKLRRISTVNGITSSRNYGGIFEYRYDDINYLNELDMIHTTDGFVQYFNEPWGDRVYQYNYILKDHLGNNRLVYQNFSGNQTLVQRTDYYPFGMTSGQYQSVSDYNFQYNGKEFQRELDLAWYDYGARFNDPQIGRWRSVDPKAEKYLDLSPYNYAANNPLIFIDPNGDTITLSKELQNNEVALDAHKYWKSTDAGKAFYKLFDIGGKFENVSIEFGIDEKVITDNGKCDDCYGDTKMFAVDKKSGDKTRLYSEQEISDLKEQGADVSNLRSKTKKGEYLRFEVNTYAAKKYYKEGDSRGTNNYLYGRSLWDANIYRMRSAASTVGHESKHVLLYFNDIQRYGRPYYHGDRDHHYFIDHPNSYPGNNSFLK